MKKRIKANIMEKHGENMVKKPMIYHSEGIRLLVEQLRGMGFDNIRGEVVVGERRVDVVAEKDGLKWAFEYKGGGKGTVTSGVKQCKFLRGRFDVVVLVMEDYNIPEGTKRYLKKKGILVWNREMMGVSLDVPSFKRIKEAL